VLLVGGDDAVAESCARAAAPLPVVRARRLAVAADRVRAMRPIVVLVAPDVSVEDARALDRLATEEGTRFVRIDEGDDDVALRSALRGKA
jgi:hypothetical protein